MGEAAPIRVLLVSHSDVTRVRAESGLITRAHVILDVANSAAEADQLVRVNRYDVLVVDGDLRPEGGFCWLYEVRAVGDFTGVSTPPAVVLAARAGDRFLADWARADEMMLKPPDPFVLADLVDRLAATIRATL